MAFGQAEHPAHDECGQPLREIPAEVELRAVDLGQQLARARPRELRERPDGGWSEPGDEQPADPVVVRRIHIHQIPAPAHALRVGEGLPVSQRGGHVGVA